jgi:hypothetical protein
MSEMNAVEVADRQRRRPRYRARKAAKNPHLMPEKMGNYTGLCPAMLVGVGSGQSAIEPAANNWRRRYIVPTNCCKPLLVPATDRRYLADMR